MVLSNWISIARGTWGVEVARGVFETTGVIVTDGVIEIVGDRVIVEVNVIEGVNVGVIVGGKKRYTSGSIWVVISAAKIPRIAAHKSIRQPRTMRSLRMRKKGSFRAPLIDETPPTTSNTAAIRARTITVWAAVWISSDIRIYYAG
jgi:hypothetical protein